MSILQKNKITFKTNIDFNYISKLISEGNYNSKIVSPYQNDYVMHSITHIRDIHLHKDFIDLYSYCNENYNKQNLNSNLIMFFSMKLGSSSITHKDDEDVYIIGAHGKTLYNVDGTEHTVETGDLLKIPKGSIHTAIGLTPRVILSFGVFEA